MIEVRSGANGDRLEDSSEITPSCCVCLRPFGSDRIPPICPWSIRQIHMYDLSTGQPFESSYVWFCRINQGKIGGIRSLPDGLGPTQQLGVISELSSNRSPFTRTEPQSQ